MVIRCLPAVMLAAALLPVGAHADPVTLTAHPLIDGATASLPAALVSRAPLDSVERLAKTSNPNARSAVAAAVRASGSPGVTSNPRSAYLMELIVFGDDSPWGGATGQVLGPQGSGGAGGAAPFHISVADEFSSSSSRGNGGGASFTENAGLERSAAFAAAGNATIAINSNGNAAEVLLFNALAGVPGLRIAFDFTDFLSGGRSFLITVGPAASPFDEENGVSTTPEPASMLLIGTGLAGVFAARRRRKESDPTND